MAKLNPIQQPAAAALMEEGPVDPHQDFLQSVDMTQLHRCVHLHESLGKLPVFQVFFTAACCNAGMCRSLRSLCCQVQFLEQQSTSRQNF